VNRSASQIADPRDHFEARKDMREMVALMSKSSSNA
jgi:hypothetical protein